MLKIISPFVICALSLFIDNNFFSLVNVMEFLKKIKVFVFTNLSLFTHFNEFIERQVLIIFKDS